MRGSDHQLWVVKFNNNPQGSRILANELIGTLLAAALGLSVPTCRTIHVSEQIIMPNEHMIVDHGQRVERCHMGLQFASLYIKHSLYEKPVRVALPSHILNSANRAQFAGALAFDKWTGNTDSRQSLVTSKSSGSCPSVMFIDQGFCFNGNNWTFPEWSRQGAFPDKRVYSEIDGWSDFEPWLSRIEEFSPEILWKIAAKVPPHWYGGKLADLDALIETLLRRRHQVRDSITRFRNSEGDPFPNWAD